MTIFHVSLAAARRVPTLLAAGQCSRSDLINHLVTLGYEDGPAIQREADGYLVVGSRDVVMRDVNVSKETLEKLSDIARVCRIRGERASTNLPALALEAILTDLIVPVGGMALAPAVREELPKHTILYLSDRALAGLQRLYVGVNSPRVAPRHDVQLRRVLTDLASYRLERQDPAPVLIATPRHKRHVTVDPWVIFHFSREGRRLEIFPRGGGKRSPTSVAAWVLELIGQGVLIPSQLTVLSGAAS